MLLRDEQPEIYLKTIEDCEDLDKADVTFGELEVQCCSSHNLFKVHLRGSREVLNQSWGN